MVTKRKEGHAVRLDGASLTLSDVMNVARLGYRVEIDPAAAKRVEQASAAVRAWENSDDVIYGVTTGFGDLASVKISRKDRRQLQRTLKRRLRRGTPSRGHHEGHAVFGSTAHSGTPGSARD